MDTQQVALFKLVVGEDPDPLRMSFFPDLNEESQILKSKWTEEIREVQKLLLTFKFSIVSPPAVKVLSLQRV